TRVARRKQPGAGVHGQPVRVARQRGEGAHDTARRDLEDCVVVVGSQVQLLPIELDVRNGRTDGNEDRRHQSEWIVDDHVPRAPADYEKATAWWPVSRSDRHSVQELPSDTAVE